MKSSFLALCACCLLGLVFGCGSHSGVEMPAKPAPMPKNPKLSEMPAPNAKTSSTQVPLKQ